MGLARMFCAQYPQITSTRLPILVRTVSAAPWSARRMAGRAGSGGRRLLLVVRADQAGGGGPSAGSGGGAENNNDGPSAISLVRKYPGPGYTFVLAGFLKILTIGFVATGAPNEATRTAAGQVSSYLMVPVGLGLCWLAKQIVDSGLNESRRFLMGMTAVLVFLYFGLIKVLYTASPDVLLRPQRPRPRMPGQMAELRAGAGDRDLTNLTLQGARPYELERGDKHKLYDDLSYYDSRYAATGQSTRRPERGAWEAGASSDEGGEVFGRAGLRRGEAGAAQEEGGERLLTRRTQGINRRSFLPSDDL